MKAISLGVLAVAALAIPATLTVAPAQAGVKVTVSPTYVPAIYCSYKSKDWLEKGIVTCPTGWAPIGFMGTRWKVSKSTSLCWSNYGAGGKEYSGYWSPCK